MITLSLGSQPIRWRFAKPESVRKGIAVFAVVMFLWLALRTPIAVQPSMQHDAGLFMALGQRLAAGEWLGPYSQFTLMKGPGYPVFLAINAWLGLPVGLSHAAFQCAAIALFFWVFARTTNMRNLALFGFVFTLWAPAPYLLSEIERSGIYAGETLLVLATLYYALFGELPPKGRLGWALLSGLLTGWLVLTREEGVWIVPGIAIIALYGAWCAWRRHALARDALLPLLVMMAALFTVQGGYSLVNFAAYGRATGVETNSAPFKDALKALQSVEAGPRIPYVPVSRQARFAIYAVSPSFRSLKRYFDPANGKTPWQPGCRYYPETCGDIAGGWFMWALREAVSRKGHYRSPARAAAFYETLTAEVTQACRDHRLKCSSTPFALLTHMSTAQWRKLPTSLYTGIRLITAAQPAAPYPRKSTGTPEAIEASRAFLGNPVIKPRIQNPNEPEFHVAGWYRSPTGSWISGQVELANGQTQGIPIPRIASPDLVAAFKDPSTSENRFDLTFRCRKPCRFSFVDTHGATLPLDLVQLTGRRFSKSLGAATLRIDAIRGPAVRGSRTHIQATASDAVRGFFDRTYSIFLPWLAGAALLAMFIVAVRAVFVRRLDAIAVLAVAVWAMLATRLLLLGIVDISSFRGIQPRLLAPAYLLICLAVVLTFAALKAMRGGPGRLNSPGSLSS